MGGADLFTVDVYGRVNTEVVQECLHIQHGDREFGGRMQFSIISHKGMSSIQVNMFVEDLTHL